MPPFKFTQSNRAKPTPKATPVNPTRMLRKVYNPAVKKLPPSSKEMTSKPKVENVVKAPKKPTPIPKRQRGLMVNRSMNKIFKNPKRNAPLTLIRNVCKGKPWFHLLEIQAPRP